MTNSERYHFSDFTYENYRRLLRLARKTYTFETYASFNRDSRFVLWRHDVDYSMHSALKLARIEAEEGVKATYFLYFHSELYNLLEFSVTNLARQIIKLGHHIGLHFSSAYYKVADEGEIDIHLGREKRMLEELFGKEVRAFSFHNPDDFTMKCRKWQYAGLINTYADYFQTEVGYCSDSNGYWRFRRLEDVLREAGDEKLQVLTHPELWQETIMSPKQRIYHCIEGRAKSTKNYYDTLLKGAGRENIDWD